MPFPFNVLCQASLFHGDSSVSSLCLFSFPLPAFLLFSVPMSSTCVSFPCTCVQLSPPSPWIEVLVFPLCLCHCAPWMALSVFNCCDLDFALITLTISNWTSSCFFYSFEQIMTKRITMNLTHAQPRQCGQSLPHFWSLKQHNWGWSLACSYVGPLRNSQTFWWLIYDNYQ